MNNRGQSLLEVILAMAIFGIISATMISLSLGGFVSLGQGGEQTAAEGLAQEGVEAVRSIKDRAWNELVFVTSSVSVKNQQWVLSGEGTTEKIGKYSRVISFADVCRDDKHNIAVCPAAYNDVQTKNLASVVTWLVRAGVENTVQQVSLVTNWDAKQWVQTNWRGGFGQKIWSDSSKYGSDDGNVDNTKIGQVQLVALSGNGCGQIKWDFSNVSQYVYDSSKIEVVSGFGQLKELGGLCTGPSHACSGLTTKMSCQKNSSCHWESSFASDGPSISDKDPFTTSRIGFWSAFSETAVKNGGEIYYQLSDDSGASWKYWNGSDWVNTQVLTDYNLASVVSANISNFSTSTKSIMFKAFLVNDGAKTTKLDQIQVDCTRQHDWDFSGSAGYTRLNSLSMLPSNLSQWVGFKETSAKNGGEIYYQLSDDKGKTWKYWNGSAWAVAGANNYNTAHAVDLNISKFPVSTGKIAFKVFVSDNNKAQLNKVSILWQEQSHVGGYESSGSLVSSAFNLGDASPVTIIGWNQDLSKCLPDCSVEFQVRTAPNNAGAPGAWSEWYGKGGVGKYFFDPRGTLISKDLNWNRWAQYRVELNGDGANTPVLEDVTINYQ